MKNVTLVATFVLSMLATEFAAAQCSGHQYYQPVYSQPVYSQPVYSQPVYSQPMTYSQPAMHQPVATQPAVSKNILTARQFTEQAKTKFIAADYAGAKAQLDQVCKLAPKDTSAFQFRSLAQFAQGNYKAAAADVYDALKIGNAWTKPVVNSLYASQTPQYAKHVQTLKDAAAKPDANMQVHFLMAYHSLIEENWQAAQTHLKKVLELQPQEPMSTQLLAAVDKKIKS